MGRSALHPGLQCTATGVSVHCVRTCSALRPKQSQTHVLARTDARTCGDGCTYLRGQMLNEGFSRKRLRERLQCFAGAVANVCGNGCNALRLRGAKLELKSSVLFWMREKTAP